MSASLDHDEFPILCETCLGENPLLRMTRAPYAKACKTCDRPFTVFRWKPGPQARYKKTELCRTCASLKNVCQTCVLDLQYGLPVQVRDSVLREEDRIELPKSDVGRALMIERYERGIANAVGPAAATLSTDLSSALSSASSAAVNPAALSAAYAKLTSKDAVLSRLSRPAPYYKRNEAHLCSFFARGECNRGNLCTYRHEMPPPPSELSKQNIRDRYNGSNDPVANKMLARVRGGGGLGGRGGAAVDNPELPPPADASITTLWLGGLLAEEGDASAAAAVEDELQRLFAPYGALRHIRVLPAKRCGFVSFVSRVSAEEAARRAGAECGQKGWTLRWAKGRAEREGGAAAAEELMRPSSSSSSSSSASSSLPPSFTSSLPPVAFPPLPPPPGMSLQQYPSQNPHQSAAKFDTEG